MAVGTLEAGQDVASFNPLFFWQEKRGLLPDTDADVYDVAAWKDRGWRQLIDTVNGAQVTKRNPKVPVTGDRLGRVKNIASGDDGVSLGLQLLYPEIDLMQIISSMQKAIQGATTEVVTLTITTAASANGNASVVLDGMITPVPLLATDNTPAAVAAKIRGTAFAGWTTSGTDAAVIFAAITPGRKGAASFAGGTSQAAGTIEKTVDGQAAKNSRYVSKKAETVFMFGFEGIAEEGTLFGPETVVRGLAYACENTANADWVWRETGVDALIRPTLTLECLPAPIADEQLEGSGISRNLIDPNRKFNYIDSPVLS